MPTRSWNSHGFGLGLTVPESVARPLRAVLDRTSRRGPESNGAAQPVQGDQADTTAAATVEERPTDLELASEAEFRSRFPGCETGAMPPFGNLFGLPVFVDERLIKEKEIAFSAGSHNEVIRMKYADFDRLVEPRILKFVAGRAHAA